MEKRNSAQPLREVINAARLWPIWVRIGLQDLRLRYQRSVLGLAWIFINLAIFILAVGIVYSQLLGQDMKSFLPFLTIGLVCWGYLTSSIVEGGNAFVFSEGYIKQIGLPIYVYVFRFFVSITVTMFISLPAYFVVALVYSVPFQWGTLWALPGLLLLTIVSFLMIAIFSHLNARFRDVGHMASLALQVLFFVTPVLWPPEMLGRRHLRWVVDLNPFYHLLELVRRPLLTSRSATSMNYLIVFLLIGVLFIIAWVYTKCYNKRVVYFL
ncbi:MAG: ABC transporter permease [Desulfobacterales bacterium]|nr:ABC transporter permease [Desulfobacterales bacterium]